MQKFAKVLWVVGIWAALAMAAGASPPKQTARVDLRIEVLDPIALGKPARLKLVAVPQVDAPVLRLTWLVPPGALVLGGPTTWTGVASAGRSEELTLTVRVADLSPRVFLAGATLQWPGGARQVRSVSVELPAGGQPKAPPGPPVTKNSRGEPIVEHVVTP